MVAVPVGVAVGGGGVIVAVSVGVRVPVAVALAVGVALGVTDGLGVGLTLGSGVAVEASVGLALGIWVGVALGSGVDVGVRVRLGIGVLVRVALGAEVDVIVGVPVMVGVFVGVLLRVAVGESVGGEVGVTEKVGRGVGTRTTKFAGFPRLAPVSRTWTVRSVSPKGKSSSDPMVKMVQYWIVLPTPTKPDLPLSRIVHASSADGMVLNLQPKSFITLASVCGSAVEALTPGTPPGVTVGVAPGPADTLSQTKVLPLPKSRLGTIWRSGRTPGSDGSEWKVSKPGSWPLVPALASTTI